MKIFWSGAEFLFNRMNEVDEMLWNMISFQNMKNCSSLKHEKFNALINKSSLIAVDSGAFSFQMGKRAAWEEHTEKYVEFISRYTSNPKLVGFFEMDIDILIGYEEVLKLRRILERVSDKIIPVWHKNRGIENFKLMCEEYSGRIVAVSGFINRDIRDDQYLLFVKTAWDHNCKIWCLGMSHQQVLDKVPFDYTDSTSWMHEQWYRRFSTKSGSKRIADEFVRNKNSKPLRCVAYQEGVRKQKYYYYKWRHYEKNYVGIRG